MRKQGLVHLHALGTQLRTHLEDRRDVPPRTFDRYDELDASPSAIYRRKEVHLRAVRILLDDLSTAIEAERLADGPPTPDGGTETTPDEE